MRSSKKAFGGFVVLGAVLGVLLLCAILFAFYANSENAAPRENPGDAWIGHYEFVEFIAPTEEEAEYGYAWLWEYLIDIRKEDDKCTADIVINGYQTMNRYKTRVVGDENEIFFVFEEYLPDNVFEMFERGDLLLRFVKNGEEIHTVWYGMQPNVESDAPVRFERIALEERDDER
jgi:hypothetical protein